MAMRGASKFIISIQNVSAFSSVNESYQNDSGLEKFQENLTRKATSQECAISDCVPGVFLPIWLPCAEEADALTKLYRAVVYLLALAYVLFGVNIISDRMISCIEVIIAQKKTIRIKTANGDVQTVKVAIWHPVVATLTVYVIGSSAAEIFLPTIEMVKHHFVAHNLGSSLIFGSGAYHLFAITGLCLASVKETDGKPIEDLRVFFVTTSFAIFAYLWIFFLVDLISPGEITLWEAVVTLALFPILVFAAWFAERRLDKEIIRSIRNFGSTITPSGEDMVEVLAACGNAILEVEKRRRLAGLLKQLKATYPEKDLLELEGMAQIHLLQSLPKGAAFYRMQASKAISGGGDVISRERVQKRLEQERKLKEENRAKEADSRVQIVGFFGDPQITVMESCGSVTVLVKRLGAGIDETFLFVDYETVDGSAIAGPDYVKGSGTLEFAPDITAIEIAIKIVDDDEFEDDKDFSIVLSNPRLKGTDKSSAQIYSATIEKGQVRIKILDDDHCGVFQFESSYIALPDNIGIAKIKVVRSTGARGRVKISFKITDGSARVGTDYKAPSEPSVTFENDQFEAFIELELVDTDRSGEIFTFFIELQQPVILTQSPTNTQGNPIIGENDRVRIGICEDNELAEALDRILCLGDLADLIMSTTWSDQFLEAIIFKPVYSGGKDDNVLILSSKMFCQLLSLFKQYVLYSLSLPWKLISATIPPPRYLHGWLAFILLLILMAFLSALIGDLASAFGCTIGLKDTVTAITLIAFGINLPDTFASRHAAIYEKTADAAIGHITGSNAVNVFLGLGMSWTLAASYHTYMGTTFTLPSGNMGFIVAVYCALSTAAVITIMIRRLPPIRGELGGPRAVKHASAAFFLLLWITFVVLLTLESYCFIEGF